VVIGSLVDLGASGAAEKLGIGSVYRNRRPHDETLQLNSARRVDRPSFAHQRVLPADASFSVRPKDRFCVPTDCLEWPPRAMCERPHRELHDTGWH
jgi:hypothetical protein